MYADRALLVLAYWRVGMVRDALAGLPDRAVLVIRRSWEGVDQHYVLDAGSVRIAVQDLAPDAELGRALYLTELQPNRTVAVDDDEIELQAGDVLLRQREIVGVVRADSGDRGTGRGDHEGLATNSVRGPSTVTPDAAVQAGRRFRAFVALEAPDSASVGTRFDLTVGFAATRQTADPAEQPVIVAGAPDQLAFVVQVAGFGFTFPEGIRRDLVVARDAPYGPQVSFAVEASDVAERATRTVEVSFEYGGELCGLAWHDVVVTSSPTRATPHDQPGAQPLPLVADESPPGVGPLARSGGTGVAIDVGSATPSLTVEIRVEPGNPALEWVFHPREDVERPSDRVLVELEAPSAQLFAEQIMAQLPAAKGALGLEDVVRGMGQFVNRVVPDEFWAMVEATWRATPQGAVPSLLLTTGEPFIPWELAWVDEDVVDPAVLPDGVTGAPLGALWRVGRWVPPVRRRRGPDRPASPPESRIDVAAMAVVIGDYASDAKIRNLPFAIEEGNAIALRYGGVPLSATEGDVDRLMSAELQRDGAAYTPAAVHFASHGQVSNTQQQYTGIILSGGRRLDLLRVRGSQLGRASAPFVFLNACQVGAASTILSAYGGLAGAFLEIGCRGFLAPLWNVDDDVAKEIALRFYERTLSDGVPVGEAVREIRAGFGDGAGGTSTPLAYVFYGHPDLVLSRSRPGSSEGGLT